MNFKFSWQEQYLTSERSLERKIHNFSPPCNILYVKSNTIDRIKADLAKKLRKFVNDFAEERKKGLACFSSPICVITAIFS